VPEEDSLRKGRKEKRNCHFQKGGEGGDSTEHARRDRESTLLCSMERKSASGKKGVGD